MVTMLNEFLYIAAIRASYGMNGIFMHNKDLLVFADYLRKNQVKNATRVKLLDIYIVAVLCTG